MSYTIDKFDISGNAWMNTVWHYERDILKGKSYPRNPKTLAKQRKKLYNFTMESDGNKITFDSEQDYVWFILKWS